MAANLLGLYVAIAQDSDTYDITSIGVAQTLQQAQAACASHSKRATPKETLEWYAHVQLDQECWVAETKEFWYQVNFAPYVAA